MDHLEILAAIPHYVTETHLAFPNHRIGKVRDTYDLADDHLLLVTTDRQSGFDRNLGAIPFKGEVLNRTSLYWFAQTAHIVGNHVVASPHARALVSRRCRVLPIEFVVRGYMTGSTDTAIWTQYAAGARSFCGHTLREGYAKNEPLDAPLLTPTTKDAAHDRPITAEEILAQGLLTAAAWRFASERALALFRFGQQHAAERGLILVDTKYEFGVAADGEILLIDEVHTPDSSRYWVAASYDDRVAAGQEPDMFDKEFFRLWFRARCDPYRDAVLPTAPPDLVAELSARYIELFERLTGTSFVPDTRPLDDSLFAEWAR